MKHLKSVLLSGVIGAVLMAAPSHAQNVNALDTRLDRLEREMQTLSRSVFKGDVPPPQISSGSSVDAQQAAQMEVRMNQIEEQLRRVTGMVEENSYALRQLSEQMREAPVQASQNQYQNDSGNGIANNASSANAGANQPNQPYQLGTLNNSQNQGNATTPAGLYDQAFSYLQTNDYVSAQATFQDFIEQYPENGLAANAKYWLGETYYAREQYQDASRAFARAFKDHPDGQKAPDTLLKLAMSLQGQDMTNEACLTLTELKTRFPNAPASIINKASDEQQSYGCE